MSVVGIDFGGGNCVIAAAQKGGVDILTNETSSRQTPTMAGFGEKERAIGEAAMTSYLRNIKNTVTNIKRLIGRKYNEPEVQQEIASLPYKVVELPDNNIGIEVMFLNERKVFTPVAITGMILHKLKDIAEIALSRPVKDVVISVPGFWTDHQRRALLDASYVADLNPLRLINDNTATALGYGIYKTNLSETEPISVMFIDMGLSTTSVSVVEFLKGKLKVVSSAFERNFGGRDFDKLLVDHFAKEFKEKYKIDVKSNARALIRLETACERLKKVLNTVPEAPINIDSIMEDKDVRGMMKRTEFEEVCNRNGMAERFLVPVRQALEDAKITPDKLFAVEIVGGGTRLKFVQQKLAEFLKKEISETLNHEEAVSKGCALQCAMLSPLFKVREFSVTDITPYPVKVSWSAEPNTMQVGEDSTEVFSRFNQFPSSKMVTLYRKGPFDLVVQYSQPELLPTGTDPLIAKYAINVPQKEEASKICVKMKLDLHQITTVDSAELVEKIEEPEPTPAPATTETPAATSDEMKVEQTETKPAADAKGTEEKPKKKKVKRVNLSLNGRSFGLSEKELQAYAEEEAQMTASDRLAIETAEKKNAVESYIYDTRSKLAEKYSSFASEKEKETLSKMFEDTETWLYEEGENETKSAYVKKLDELKAIGDPIARRYYEFDNRFDALSSLRKTIEQFRLAATTSDPKYEHIDPEEKKRVVEQCNLVEKFINDQMAKQETLPKHVDPIFFVSEIEKKKADLERFCTPILNKPKPKVEPPKPAAPTEPKKEETKPAEGATGANNTTEPPKTGEMDLD